MAIAFSLLMGCLVGGYLVGTSSPTLTGVVLSALALAVPATSSVALDERIGRRAVAVTGVAATAALLGGLLIASAAHPAFWQSYSSDAGWFSVLAAMLLAPVAAGFAVGTLGTRPEPEKDWEAGAIACGLSAWAGVGLQAVALPYLVPFARGLFAVLVLHQPMPPGGLSYRWGVVLFIVFGLIVLYAFGFGLAVLGGLLGGALRSRLMRPRRRPGHVPPPPEFGATA